MKLELLSNLRQQVMVVFAQKGYQKSCIIGIAIPGIIFRVTWNFTATRSTHQKLELSFLMTVMVKGNTMNYPTGRKRFSDT